MKRTRALILLVSAFGLSACSGSDPLAEASGPVFQLNTGLPQDPATIAPAVALTPALVAPVVPLPVQPPPQRKYGNQGEKSVRGRPRVIVTADELNNESLAEHRDGATYSVPRASLRPTSDAPVNVTSVLSPAAVTRPLIPAAVLARSSLPPPPLPRVVIPVPVIPQPVWYLTANTLIGKDLQSWGQTAGWTVLWQASQDWPVPATTQFQGSFQTVSTTVLTDLASQGANIRAKFYVGNRTLIVFQPGATDAQ